MNLNFKLPYSKSGTLGWLWLLILITLNHPNLFGQQTGGTITVEPGGTITSSGVTGNTTTLGYSTTYVLVCGGNVEASNSTPSFTAPSTTQTCTMYAVNHDSSWSPAAVGSPWNAPTTECAEFIARLVQVQDCLSVCAEATLTAPAITGANLTGTYRLDYVLVCGSTITTNAATADGGTGSTSFAAPSTAQTCTLYAVNYDNAAGTPSYSGDLTVSGNTCYSVIDRCVTVNDLPILTVQDISNSCPTTTADLTTAITSSTTGLTLSYFESDGTTAVADETAVDAGTYVVVVTSSTTPSCSTSATVVVTVTACACTPATICEGDAFGLQTVNQVNNTTGYSVALVLVCNDAVVSITDATDVGTADATMGVSEGTITDIAPAPPTTCSIWAVNYQGSGLATGDIAVATGNQITVNNFTCEEKIEKCYTINPKVTQPTVANEQVCLNGSVTITPTAPALPATVYISAILGNQGTTDANGDGIADFCDEYIEISACKATNLSGFILTDNATTRHTFPAGSVIPAGGKLVLFSGPGGGIPSNTASAIYQVMTNGTNSCATSGVWNNTGGDIATLLDGSTTVATASYAGAPSVGTPNVFAQPTTPATFTFYSDAALTTAVATDVADFTVDNTTTPNTATVGNIDLWVVVSNGCCSGDTAKLTITINPLPTAADAALSVCDDNTDGFADFTLTDANVTVLNGQSVTDFTVTYHVTQVDADADANALTSPYTNTTANSQIIYARVEDNVTGCYETSQVTLTVNPLPILTVQDIANSCPTTTADLTTAITSSITNLSISYFESDGTTAVADETAVDAGTYVVVVTSSTTPSCSTSATVVVNINSCGCTATYEVCDGSTLPVLTNPPTGAATTANIAIGSVNTTSPYQVDFVLVCGDVVAETISNATIGDVNATTGTASATLAHTFVIGESCLLYAVNYDSSTGTPAYSATTGNNLVQTNTAVVCLEKVSACIDINALPTASTLNGITNVSCNGLSDGAIDLTATGAATLTYEWDNDGVAPADATADAEDLSGLTAATYNVTVTDGNGCSATASATVSEPTALVASASATDALCNGDKGSVDVTATGGTSPYTGTGTFNEVAGTYTYTVTDANGCSATASATVSEPTALTVAVDATANPTCNGATLQSDGTISITATGGTSPYTYDWSNDGAETPDDDSDDLTGLSATTAGTTYTVTITDANGCATNTSVTLVGTTCVGLGSIGNYVWVDLNNDGTQNDGASSGVNGVTVNLLDASGNPILDGSGNPITTVTANDSNGNPGYYQFTNLSAGDYIVEFVLPTGASFTTTQNTGAISNTSNNSDSDSNVSTNNGQTGVITLGGGETINTVDAGLAPASLGNYVWYDYNGDGIQNEPTTAGINGVTVNLLDSNGNIVATTVTDSNGYYNFNVIPGTYTVQIILPTGAIITYTQDASAIDNTNDTTGDNATDSNIASSTTTTAMSSAATVVFGDALTGVDFGLVVPCTANVSDIPDNTICEGDTNADNTLSFPLEPYSAIYGAAPAPAAAFALAYILTDNAGNIIAFQDMGAPYNTASNTPSFTYSGLADGTYRMYEIIYRVADGPLTGTGAGSNVNTIGLTQTSTCLDATYGNIYVNPAPPATASNTGPICAGDDVLLIANGGVSYAWEHGPTSSVDTETPSATTTYTVTVTSSNGCSATATTEVTVNPLPAPTVADVTICPGGTATLENTEGFSAYAWSTGATTSSITVSPSATTSYTLTVTDSNGCRATTSASVNVLNPTASITPANPIITCANNGEVVLTAGPAGAVSYSWSGPGIVSGGSTNQATVNAVGTYVVTVTSGTAPNTCTATASVVVTQDISQPFLLVSTPQGTALSCSVSSVSLVASYFPTSGSSVVWTRPDGTTATTANINATQAGDYTVVVTASNGCTSSTSINVTSTNNISVSIATPATLTCTTTSTQLSATAIGASTYSWTASNGGNIVSGAATATPTVDAAGDYTVVVTNGACSSTSTVTVVANTTAPANVSAGADVVLNCTTTSTSLTASSTTVGVTYTWTTPSGFTSTANPLTNITQNGNYTVVVTNTANGCTASDVVNVSTNTTPPGASISTPDGTTLDCITTSVDLTVSTAGIILWSTSETSSTINVTSGGTYSVTTTGANGCTSIASVTINAIATLNADATVTDALCNGGSGSINVNVSGGTGSYTYAWSNGATTQDLSSVVAGTYTLTITDAGNTSCTVVLTQTVNEPIRISITVDSTSPATCGSTNGAINISVNGGTGSYGYLWSNGATTQDLSNVAAGTYFVIVSDANGCSTSASAQVTTPSGLAVNLGVNGITDVACNGGNTGAIDVTVVGGTTPYSYLWSNGETTQDLSNLSAGDYDLTVTDGAGCSVLFFGTVGEPALLALSSTVTPEICSDGAIDLTVTGGKGPYSYVWSNGETSQDNSGLIAGTYTVTVTDNNNCVISTSIVVTQTPMPTNNDGPACEDGTITIGFGTYANVGETVNYSWSGPNSYSLSGSFVSTGQDLITADLNNLQLVDAGIYTVTVTFANGCTRTGQTNIKVDGKPLIDPVVTCNGSVGTITMNAQSIPSNSGVAYSFNGGAYATGTGVFSGLSNGDYNIAVSDLVSGCVTTTTVNVNCVVACPVPVASSNGSPACVGQPISLSVNPNLPLGVTATYLWTKQGSTATSTAQNPNLGLATINKAGTYTVQVTYSNGCVATASTTIVVNQLPTATASVACNGTTGTITVTANSNPVSNGVQYSLDGVNYGNINTVNRPNGNYTIYVRDVVTLCVRTISVTVNCNACPTAVASNSGPVCSGTSVTLSANPNLPTGVTATYSWNGPAGGSALQNPTIVNVTPAKAGIYTVTVTYSNGCTSVASTNVVVSPKPTVSAIASCDPATGGIITITATGGSGFTYNWNGNIQSSNVFPSVPNDSYTVTATNSAGCTGTANVTVSCVTCQASVGVVSVSSGNCVGEQISASGVFNNSTGYSNYLLLTDENGTILEVQAGPNATFTTTSVGGNTYLVYAYTVKTPSGGPNPPAVGSNVSGITGSCYDLSTGSELATIIPPPPMFEVTSNTQEGNNGGISPFEYNTDVIVVEGGTLPYDFTWDNTGYVRYDIVYGDVDANGDGSTMPGATITIYYTDDAQWNVTITDISGCASNQIISTNDFGNGTNVILDIDAFETHSCSDINGADGSIDLTITGGDCGGIYTYEWYGPAEWDGSGLTATANGTFTETGGGNYTIEGLPSGWYAVTVTCGDQMTEGWYWVPLGTRGRTKLQSSMMTVQPNPFAEQTMISFMTEGSTTAKVLVYAADGKLVNTLFNGKVNDKTLYNLPFRGEGLPSGMYVVQLITDNNTTKYEKLIIAR